jgi:hypothetical protein
MEKPKGNENAFKFAMEWIYSAYCFHVETDSYFPGRDFHLSKLHPESNDAYPSENDTATSFEVLLEKCIR